MQMINVIKGRHVFVDWYWVRYFCRWYFLPSWRCSTRSYPGIALSFSCLGSRPPRLSRLWLNKCICTYDSDWDQHCQQDDCGCWEATALVVAAALGGDWGGRNCHVSEALACVNHILDVLLGADCGVRAGCVGGGDGHVNVDWALGDGEYHDLIESHSGCVSNCVDEAEIVLLEDCKGGIKGDWDQKVEVADAGSWVESEAGVAGGAGVGVALAGEAVSRAGSTVLDGLLDRIAFDGAGLGVNEAVGAEEAEGGADAGEAVRGTGDAGVAGGVEVASDQAAQAHWGVGSHASPAVGGGITGSTGLSESGAIAVLSENVAHGACNAVSVGVAGEIGDTGSSWQGVALVASEADEGTWCAAGLAGVDTLNLALEVLVQEVAIITSSAASAYDAAGTVHGAWGLVDADVAAVQVPSSHTFGAGYQVGGVAHQASFWAGDATGRGWSETLEAQVTGHCCGCGWGGLLVGAVWDGVGDIFGQDAGGANEDVSLDAGGAGGGDRVGAGGAGELALLAGPVTGQEGVRPAVIALGGVGRVAVLAVAGGSAGHAVGLAGDHVEAEEAGPADLGVGGGAGQAGLVAAGLIVHAEHGLDKGDSEVGEGHGAPGAVGAGLAPGLAGHAQHGGHVHPVSFRAGGASCHVGGGVVGAGFAGEGVGAERAGVVAQEPEVGGTGGADCGAGAGGASSHTWGASSVLLEPSGSTCSAAGVARVGTGCAPWVIAKEAGVAGRKNVGTQAWGAASVSIAGGTRVVADDTLIVDASVGRY